MKIADLTRDLMLPLEEMEAVLQEFEDEFLDPTRGIQLRRRGRAVRIEIKGPYIFLIGEFFQERRSKPICDQSNELLAVIAHTQPVSVQGISDIRGIDSAAVTSSLAESGLRQRSNRLGPKREWLWKVSQRFLELHNLNSAEKIFEEKVEEWVFPGLKVSGTAKLSPEP